MPLWTPSDYCFEPHPGGLSKRWADEKAEVLAGTLAELKTGAWHGAKPLIELPYRTDDLPIIKELASDIRSRFTSVVIAGAGGSSLSGEILASFAHTHLTPRLHFLDTIDPDAISQLLGQIDTAKTCFIFISKSGTTVETLGHFYVLLEHAKTHLTPEQIAHQCIVITTPGDDNPMYETARHHSMRVLGHEAHIGGRFSCLSNVGLLPGAIAGLDIDALRSGAKQVVEELRAAPSPQECASAMGAVIQYGFMEQGRNISVMLPYSKRLSGFSSWYRQSWAESLGKSGKGTTPIRAVGTTDQHSQLQLYLDGPKDKLFHLITVKRAHTGQKIHVPGASAFLYLDGKTTGDVMESQQKATLATLINRGCPVRHFELETLSEKHLGALIMHFTLEIMFMSRLLHVNPFDQPAVEESKQIARAHMGAV